MVHDIKIIHPQMNGQAMKVMIDGEQYESYNSLPYSDSSIKRYMKDTGCSLEEAIDYVMCKEKERRQKRHEQFEKEAAYRKEIYEKRKFEYNGIVYSHFRHAICCLNEKYGYSLNAGSIANAAKKKGISMQEAIDLALDRQMKRVQQKLKVSQRELERDCGIRYKNMYNGGYQNEIRNDYKKWRYHIFCFRSRG